MHVPSAHPFRIGGTRRFGEGDRFGVFAQGRYIGNGVYDATYDGEDLARDENRIGAVVPPRRRSAGHRLG